MGAPALLAMAAMDTAATPQVAATSMAACTKVSSLNLAILTIQLE